MAEAVNPDAGPGAVPDDIFSADGDGGAPLQAGGGSPRDANTLPHRRTRAVIKQRLPFQPLQIG